MFTRAINGLDIATGEIKVNGTYLTKGTERSLYREGNGTVQFEVLPRNATVCDPFSFGHEIVGSEILLFEVDWELSGLLILPSLV